MSSLMLWTESIGTYLPVRPPSALVRAGSASQASLPTLRVNAGAPLRATLGPSARVAGGCWRDRALCSSHPYRKTVAREKGMETARSPSAYATTLTLDFIRPLLRHGGAAFNPNTDLEVPHHTALSTAFDSHVMATLT
jgi:hypothetical protein